MKPINIEQIKLGGEIGRRIDITADYNMLAVDIEHDFLAPFRKQGDAARYVGLGHFLDATSRFARYRENEGLSRLRKRIVSELKALQEPDGYIGTFRPESRLSMLWDVHEISHLIYGLASDFLLWGERDVLNTGQRLADWLIAAWMAAPEQVSNKVVMATLDSEPAMLVMFEATGDQKYLNFCTDVLKLAEWDRPIVLGRNRRVDGHVYDYLSRCIGQVALQRWCPEHSLENPTRRALDFMLHDGGMVISGALGEHECWHDSQEGLGSLGETCATAYLIRLLHLLLQQTGNSLYGDLMERAIYNALFAAQSPDGRRLRYYTPFEGSRAYYPRDTYCCPNNFRRIVSELPQMVFLESPDGPVVNLYTACSALLKLPDGNALHIRQKTDYPRSGTVEIALEPEIAAAFSLKLRIPRWCKDVRITVNGEAIDSARGGGSFCVLNRLWRNADRIELMMQMPPRLIRGFRAQCGRAAVMSGPQLYCMNPERNRKLSGIDPRLLVIDPASLRREAEVCRIRAWGPGRNYPMQEPEHDLVLTEFADPGGSATYFKIPVPDDRMVGSDELFERT